MISYVRVFAEDINRGGIHESGIGPRLATEIVTECRRFADKLTGLIATAHTERSTGQILHAALRDKDPGS